jgi:hypothetical protein
VSTLILVGGSFVEFPIAHETLSRWIVTLVVRVKTIEKVVVVEKELAQSPRVVEPGEISIGPAAIVLL